MTVCSNCNSPVNEFFEMPYAFFRHSDFEVVKHGGILSRCGRCYMVENQLDEEDIKRMMNMFQEEKYLQCQFMKHTLSVADIGTSVSRTSLQAKLIREKVNLPNPAILEIGCFHGDLLRDLDSCYEAADLHGYDINEEFRTHFPLRENFRYWSGDLADIDRDFDIIILSGSIMYIQDIVGLMEQIRRLLRPDGVVFVQTADISKNPYAILLGDQFYHYTPVIMKNMFRSHGFSFEPFECEWFPKECLGFARNDCDTSSFPMEKDDAVSWCIETINQKIGQIRVQTEGISCFGMLGTTSAAAFVDSLLGSKIGFFVDENPERVGLMFHGKDVLHPSDLHDEDVIIIPYGDLSVQIRARLSEKYKGQFICL